MVYLHHGQAKTTTYRMIYDFAFFSSGLGFLNSGLLWLSGLKRMLNPHNLQTMSACSSLSASISSQYPVLI
jgi:hypothetical protein